MKVLPLLILPLLLANCSRSRMTSSAADSLKVEIARFAPVPLSADLSRLSPGDRKALDLLVEAAGLLDTIYLRQAWSGNAATLRQLEQDGTAEGALRLQMYQLHMGPWNTLEHQRPFVEGVPDRPAGANYYPEDMTKEEFERWVSTLPAAEQERARGYFTVIRRGSDGALRIVPFREEYRAWLEPAAELLRKAADAADNASLKNFLTKRAAAFLSDDYYDSDVAWMDLDSPVEPTIGPYEVYMDELFNYKAAYEAYIAVRDDASSADLAKFSGYLQEIEDHLPIDPKFRNPKLGAAAPIRVVDLVATGGEAKSGVQTAAFNLPNDERVVKEKGSKRVMLKNVQEAKFKTVLAPIARVALSPDQQADLSFDQFFTHILAHELMHGLGPHQIVVGGRKTTVRQEMKELSSALEEAKADVAGLFALQYLIDKGTLDRSTEQSMYVTFLAGVFRSVRFGIAEAHGRGMALQFNYLLDKGAFLFDAKTGTFRVEVDAMKQGVRALTSEIMTIQAEGSYDRAKLLLDTYAVIRPEMKSVLDKLGAIPVDIAPRYSNEQAE